MADKTTNGRDDAETVDAASLGKGSNPVSRATLVMIVGAIIFIIIAVVIISSFFSAPTGNTRLGSADTTLITSR
ncbi:MAG: hypothetical protein AVDCRST_MAG74-3605 [uncultured Pyrinomonadaceae bacterium]|uniref:Uncharacterized protein n=1 Tax=uncultured Pyrinomonadaceae bacterium TaxID=2283094 RepID=A0A6J4Q0H1_9BACT|nr:MAG: hypothetical protein AVDCRST_MAG74-3605 [uncultured Pyrinomonadaceae bacterium]